MGRDLRIEFGNGGRKRDDRGFDNRGGRREFNNYGGGDRYDNRGRNFVIYLQRHIFFTFICIFNKVLENVLLVDLPDIYLEIVMKGKIVEIEEIGEEGNIFHFHFFFLIILFIYIRRSESRDRRKRRSDSRGRKYSSISKSKSRGFFFNFIDSLYNFI